MASSSKSPTVSVNLLIDKERKCVVLAEAGNDFVNALRSLLRLSLGDIALLVAKQQSMQPGCLNNLYNSVQNLGVDCFRTDACKRMLLSPRGIHYVTESTKYFLCGNWRCKYQPNSLLSFTKNSRCTCVELMNSEIGFQEVESDGLEDETEGVLSYKVETKFFITDDLRVMQGLPGGLVNYLLNLGIKNVDQIEENVVEIGSEQMSNLVTHSLVSKTTLTDVFLRKQAVLNSTSMLDEQVMLVAPSKERTENESKTSLNIMLRKSDKVVLLYAEASGEFMDLLFSFLTIPLESVLELLQVNLFKDLDTLFSLTKQKSSQKGTVLPPFYSCPNVFPNILARDPPTYYCYTVKTRKHRYYYLSYKETSIPLKLLDPKSPEPNTTKSSGYFEKNSMFVVTNDLVVKPLASVSSISLLKEIGVSLEDVEQQVISIGKVEALALLRACLCSSSALSALLNVYVKQPKQEPF